jgi:hypothetical protein
VDVSNHTRLIERFWPKVDKSGNCWQWIGSIGTGGYGMVNVDGKTRSAHRVSYSIANGEIPQGVFIDHICHNRACVNPTHLRPVTRKQNAENRSGPTVRNKAGVRGVHWHAQSKKWSVMCGHNGRRYSGGLHLTLEEAEAAAIELRNKLFSHNTLDRQAHSRRAS